MARSSVAPSINSIVNDGSIQLKKSECDDLIVMKSKIMKVPIVFAMADRYTLCMYSLDSKR